MCVGLSLPGPCVSLCFFFLLPNPPLSDLPVFPTISISAHIGRYDELPAGSHPAHLFAIPSNFTRITPQMRHERRRKAQGLPPTPPPAAHNQQPAVDLSAPMPTVAHSAVDTTRVSSSSSPRPSPPASTASAPSVVILSPVTPKNSSPSSPTTTATAPKSHESFHLLADVD